MTFLSRKVANFYKDNKIVNVYRQIANKMWMKYGSVFGKDCSEGPEDVGLLIGDVKVEDGTIKGWDYG